MTPGIERGILEVKDGTDKGEKQEYVITLLGKSQLPLIMDLQDLIVSHLHCSCLLEPFSSEFMLRHLGRRGFVLGVFCKGNLVAFRNVYYPAPHDAEWNLGLDIGISPQQMPHVANLQMVCVHPAYRGNSLALKMNLCALKLLKLQGTRYHICATVSPLNIWNIRILLKSGFHIRNLKLKYGGKLRYIVYQQLIDQVEFRKDIATSVPLDALEAQRALLESGYCAVDLQRVGGSRGAAPKGTEDWMLIFRRPVQELKVHVVPRRPGAQEKHDLPIHPANSESDSVAFHMGDDIEPPDDEP